MKKSDIKKELQERVKGAGMITKKDLMDFFNTKQVSTVNKYFAGLDKVGRGYYLISDVAENIVNMSRQN